MSKEKNQTTNTSLDEMLNNPVFMDFENIQKEHLTELTSEILKLEAGEEFLGVMTNRTEEMESQDGKSYNVGVLIDKNGGKALCGDAVFLSTQEKYFAKNPNVEGVKVLIRCIGERSSTTGGGKKYRDLKIYTF